ncbi:phospholipase D-like domain-containing protein [Paenibacillus polymyxa]|uniref:phospholipase D-like domain-containing protein n=1 Tax=Paenibacillus polymyxa TaxID=1406 RepID=UPI00234BA0E7|nr:phospholipase D-like domain-containing protein [Paenibacillus polymyxa]WCM60714.1 phospholipase D-like domain-containing protein [Paenibacillus polymyxa]
MTIDRIPILPGIEVVSSKDDLCYQDVLDDFPSAEYIFVVTYNISENNKILLQRLKDASDHAEVKVITNIPKRFDRYYGLNPRNCARDSIRNYTDRLNPEETEGMSTSFHFENHSKIVLTNNIAYIGSANFSDESARSRETGTLYSDPHIVQNIINNLVPLIEGEAIQYFGNSLNQRLLAFTLLLSEVAVASEKIKDGMYTFVGHPREDIEVFNSWDPYLSDQVISGLFDLLVELEEEIDVLKDVKGLEYLSEYLDSDILEYARRLIDDRTPIRDLSTFDYQNYASDLINDELFYVDDLGEAGNEASQLSSEKHTELAELAKESIEELFELLNQIQSSMQSVVHELSRLHRQQLTIDNT